PASKPYEKGDSTSHELPAFDLEADEDGDGFTNRQELEAGTDYQDPASKPVVANTPGETNQVDQDQIKPDQSSQEGQPSQAKPSVTGAGLTPNANTTLPNTGEADMSLIFGAASLSILAGLGLYYKKDDVIE
ncbi:TPA: LPXTG cell wall anchor domain-containing protein, partial [Streptococcus suis]